MSAQETSVLLNGEPQEVPIGQTVAGLLEYLRIPVERVAVEMNKKIVRKRDWNTTDVPPGAQIEIVEFVGGG